MNVLRFFTLSLIQRYVLWEVVRTFIIVMLVLAPLLTFGFIWNEANNEGLTFLGTMAIIPYMLPEILRIIVPMVSLLAVTFSFARINSDNEIIALKSLGIEPFRIIWPVLILGAAISLVSVTLNDTGVCWGRINVARVIISNFESIVFNKLRQSHSYSRGEFQVEVKGVDGKRLLMPTLTTRTHSIKADSAEMAFDPTNEELVIKLVNVYAVDPDGKFAYEADTEDIRFPFSSFLPNPEKDVRPSAVLLDKIDGEIQIAAGQMNDSKQEMATRTAFAMVLGDFEDAAINDWRTFETQQDNLQSRITRLRAETPRRWAAAFSCFFFIWVGAPCVIWMNRTDLFAGFFACFIPILIFYYPLLIAGMNAAKEGSIPAMFVWTANLGLFAAGFYFCHKIRKY